MSSLKKFLEINKLRTVIETSSNTQTPAGIAGVPVTRSRTFSHFGLLFLLLFVSFDFLCTPPDRWRCMPLGLSISNVRERGEGIRRSWAKGDGRER